MLASACASQTPSHATPCACDAGPAGDRAVHLRGRPVSARLRVVAAADDRLGRVAVPANPAHGRSAARAGRNVDRSGCFWSRHGIAIGRLSVRRAAGHPARPRQSGVERDAARTTGPAVEPGLRALGRARRQTNDPAERVVAVEIAGRAAHHVDLLEGRRRHAVPRNPAAERIVQRHVVGNDERPARSRRRQAAQRDALGGGIGDRRRRSTEETEAGHQPQLIVEPQRRRLRERRSIDRRHAAVEGKAGGGRVGRHGHAFGYGLRLQDDRDGRRRSRKAAHVRGESRRLHPQRDDAGRARPGYAPGAVVGRPRRGAAGGAGDGHHGARDRQAGRVGDGPGQHRRHLRKNEGEEQGRHSLGTALNR